jgi:hypothetical protein
MKDKEERRKNKEGKGEGGRGGISAVTSLWVALAQVALDKPSRLGSLRYVRARHASA